MSTIPADIKATSKEWIKDQYEHIAHKSTGAISNFRSKAYKQLEETRFPNRKDEDWKYTNFIKELKTEFSSPRLSNPIDWSDYKFEGVDAYFIVYINGFLDESSLSESKLEDGLSITPIAKALQNNDVVATIENMVEHKGGTDVNAFLPLNRSLGNTGFYISVDKNAQIEKPIHIIHINDSDSNNYISNPQVYINTGIGSNCTVIESFHSVDPGHVYFSNVASYIKVAPNSVFEHYRLQFESKSAFQVNNTIVTQGRDSVYSNYAVDFGGKTVRNNLSTELKGSGTMTNYYGAYLGDENQHLDNQTFIDHAVPHCDSNELYKGILTDKARGVFNGKVLVRQDAQKTNAFQQNSSLVLSETAIMDAKPQLEIYADDVKCSHGATIGQLDDASIFYLRSRGIPKEQAENLLQKAFVGEVINKFPIKAIRVKLLEKVDEKLSKA